MLQSETIDAWYQTNDFLLGKVCLGSNTVIELQTVRDLLLDTSLFFLRTDQLQQMFKITTLFNIKLASPQNVAVFQKSLSVVCSDDPR